MSPSLDQQVTRDLDQAIDDLAVKLDTLPANHPDRPEIARMLTDLMAIWDERRGRKR